MQKANLITSIKSRLQVVITLVAFFPAILLSLGTIAQDSPISMNKFSLQWGVIIFLYIIVYLSVEILIEKIFEKSMKIISSLLLLAVFLFAIIIFIISAVTVQDLSNIYLYVFKISFISITIIPLVIALIIIISRLTKTK